MNLIKQQSVGTVDVESREETHGQLQHEEGAGHDDAATLETGEPMPLTTVVLFDTVGQVFADMVAANRQGAGVGAVVVRAIEQDFPRFQTFQQTV